MGRYTGIIDDFDLSGYDPKLVQRAVDHFVHEERSKEKRIKANKMSRNSRSRNYAIKRSKKRG